MAEPERKVRCVIFDHGGVFGLGLDYTLLEKHTAVGQFANLKATLIKPLWNEMKVDPDYTTDRFWAQVLASEHVDSSAVTAEQLNTSMKAGFRVSFETHAVAERLQKRGVITGIISNHSKEWFEEYITRFRTKDLMSHPDLIVASYQDDIRAAKPSQEIFQSFITRASKHAEYATLTPSDCVMIDDKAANIEAARAFGMHGIQFHAKNDPISKLLDGLKALGVPADP